MDPHIDPAVKRVAGFLELDRVPDRVFAISARRILARDPLDSSDDALFGLLLEEAWSVINGASTPPQLHEAVGDIAQRYGHENARAAVNTLAMLYMIDRATWVMLGTSDEKRWLIIDTRIKRLIARLSG